MEMFNHLLFLSLLFIFGLLIVLNFRTKQQAFLSFMLSFFIGVALWGVLLLFFSILHLPVTASVLIPIATLLFVALVGMLFYQKKQILKKSEIPILLLVILIYGVVFYIFSAEVYVFATPDSYDYIKFARIFYRFNWEYTARSYVAYGPLLTFMEMGASLFSLEYFYGFVPASVVIFFIAFLSFTYEGFTLILPEKYKHILVKVFQDELWIPIPLIFSFLIGLLLFTNSFYQMMAFFIHSNPIAMIYITLTFFTTWVAVVKKDQYWLLLSAIFGTTMSISRVETFFIAIIPILFILDEKKFSQKVIQKLYLPGNILIFFWSIRKYLMSVDQSGVYVNQFYNFAIIILAAGTIAIIIFHPYLQKLNIRLITIVLILLGITFLGLGVIEYSIMSQSLFGLYSNLFNVIHWDYIWYILIPFYLYCLITPEKLKFESLFKWGILIYVILVVEFAAIRGGSYHDRWSDSGNRMMYHILPVIMFYTISKIASGRSTTETEYQ